MATFKINKVNAGYDYGSSGEYDSVYFEKVTSSGSASNWFYLKVSDKATPTVDIKNLAIFSSPNTENGDGQSSGIYFSDLTSGWNTSTMRAQIVGRHFGGSFGSYAGEAGLGKSMILSDDFIISWNATVGAYVIDVSGVGTGVTQIIAQTNETNSLLQVASSSGGTVPIGGWASSATVDGTNTYLDIRIAPVSYRTAILGDRDTSALDGVPSERYIQAGSVKDVILTTEGGDINFDAYTYTEGAVNDYISIIASDSRTSGNSSWGKQFFLDPSYFQTSTITPTGGAVASIVTLNVSSVMTNLKINADLGGPSEVSPNETLRFLTNSSVSSIFKTNIALSTGFEDIIISAVDAGADRLVFWDDSQSKLAYLEIGSGLTLSGTTLSAVGSFVSFNVSADSGTTQTIENNNLLQIVTNASSSNILQTVTSTSDIVTVAAKSPSVAGDRIVFWDNSLAGLNYLSVGTGLSLAGTTLACTISAPNSGSLSVGIGTAASGTALSWATSSGFNADSATNYTYTLNVGPALTNYATILNGSTTGFLYKTAANTLALQTPSFQFSVQGNSGTEVITNNETLQIVGISGIVTEASATNRITIGIDYNTRDFEIVNDKIQLKDKYTSDWKNSCLVNANNTSSLGVSYNYNSTGGASGRGQITWTTGPSTIDGVSISAGDRILNTEPGAASGIWVVTNINTWDRAEDFDSDDEVTSGNTVTVEEGSSFANIIYQLTTDDPITIGGASGTPLTWTAVAKTAFYGVGNGMMIDSINNQITFATADNGSIPVSINSVSEGILYAANRIRVATDGVTIGINNSGQVEATWALVEW